MGKVIDFSNKKKPVRSKKGCWRQEYLLFPYLYNLNFDDLPAKDELPEGAVVTLHPGNAARRLVNHQLLRVLALAPRDMREAVFVTPQKIIKLEYCFNKLNNCSLFANFLKKVSHYVGSLGAVVLDNLGLRCWYPEEWLEVIDKGPFELKNHLTIHTVPESGARHFWIHTHGMSQFACPDLEVRMVSEAGKEPTLRLISRLIRYQIKNGPVFREGCRIAISRRSCWITFKHYRELSGDSHYLNNYFRVLISMKKQ